MKKEITKEEKEGIKMIQFLQKMNAINESKEDALKGWRAMSEAEKENTIAAFNLFNTTKN